MRYTSFELSKQLYDKRVRIESEYSWHEPYVGPVYLATKLTISIFASVSKEIYPSLTLCELLEWLPKIVQTNGDLYVRNLTISIDPSHIHCINYRSIDGIVLMDTNFLDENPCDAAAELALWLIDNNLVAQNEL